MISSPVPRVVLAGFVLSATAHISRPEEYPRYDRVLPFETTSETSANASFGDLNGDGNLDIVLAKGRHWPLVDRVLIGDGKGGIKEAYDVGVASRKSYSGRLIDIDGDGDLDVVISNDQPSPKLVYLNDGTGHFTVGSTYGKPEWQGRNATIADMNGDGYLDLLVPHRNGGQSHLYFGAKNADLAHLRNVPFGPADAQTRIAEAADFNGDGKLDVVLIDEKTGVSVQFGHGDGTFAAPIPIGDKSIVPYALQIGDAHCDGKMDFIVGNVQAPSVVYFNDGTGTAFTPVPFGDNKGTAYGIALGDFDKDGRPDIAVARSEAPNVLYFASGPVGKCTAPAVPTARRAELRVPALTGYLLPDPDAARVGQNRPLLAFAKPASSIAWWGQIKSAGSLDAAIALRLPKSESTTLRLTVGATHRDAKVIGSDGELRASFGAFTVRDTGYVRFALSVVDGKPAPTVDVRGLLIEGAAAESAHFNLDARRNAASVHLRYPTDSNTLVTGFYNEVTAVDDPVTTYYMATGFARGYFGLQVNGPTERRIIFSVWDAADGTTAKDRSTVASDNYTKLEAKGDGVVADVFGNEGTGGHSHLVYPWKTGSTQRFFVTAKVDGNATTYNGYWFHPASQTWKLIASFRAAKDGKGLRRLYSFSENFGGNNGHLRRKALFGNQWIRLGDNSWHELTTATFSHDATGKADRLDRFMGVEDGKFFLSHGGFGPGFTTLGTAFTRPALAKPPSIALPAGN